MAQRREDEMLDPKTQMEINFLNTVNLVCKEHNCWVQWDKSDIEKGQLSINGKTHEGMVDCSERLDKIYEEYIYEEDKK